MPLLSDPKITGYRTLTQDETDLINEGKALAETCGAYVAKLRGYIPPEQAREWANPGESFDQRWISIGATDLQRGFMAITRGIARPTTF